MYKHEPVCAHHSDPCPTARCGHVSPLPWCLSCLLQTREAAASADCKTLTSWSEASCGDIEPQGTDRLPMLVPGVERGPCKGSQASGFQAGVLFPGSACFKNMSQNSSLKSCFISFQISSLKTQIQSQESDLKSQEDDLNRAKSELNRLQQEETQLEQSIQAGKVQLETIIKSLKSTQDEINQVSPRGWGGACHHWLWLGVSGVPAKWGGCHEQSSHRGVCDRRSQVSAPQ